MEERYRLCCAVGIVTAVALSPAALAQNDWGFISTGGSPDPVHTFDLSNFAGSVTQVGNAATNFNRGMDYDTRDSFYYYVSTDSLNDPGDRGLWYWDNGVNSQLATVPFSDSGGGDMSLDNTGSRLFVTVNDGDASAGDSLYVWDNLDGTPTFSEIGETGLDQLIGLAMDPVSGMLFGYDSSTEGLYTIDTNDGTPSLVGFSGESVSGVGGMDFTPDGSTLLLADGSDMLYKISTDNGGFSALADQGSFNISALSYRFEIPTPGALALLGVAGAFGLRRRRR